MNQKVKNNNKNKNNNSSNSLVFSRWPQIKIYILSLVILRFHHKTLIFYTPIPSTCTSFPLDGMARNDHFYLLGYARARNFIVFGSIFILHPYTQEKNHLDNAGIKPGSPAQQAIASRANNVHAKTPWRS